MTEKVRSHVGRSQFRFLGSIRHICRNTTGTWALHEERCLLAAQTGKVPIFGGVNGVVVIKRYTANHLENRMKCNDSVTIYTWGHEPESTKIKSE